MDTQRLEQAFDAGGGLTAGAVKVHSPSEAAPGTTSTLHAPNSA